VSDDNPFSEAIFRTCKYRPDYPAGGFAMPIQPIDATQAANRSAGVS